MTDIADLPDIFGLEWIPTTQPGVHCSLSRTRDFQDAVAAYGLPDGIIDFERVELDSDRYSGSALAVTCRPAEINLDELSAWIAAATDLIAEAKRATRRRHHDYSGKAHAVAVREAIAEAKLVLETWGLFTHAKAQIQQLIDDEFLFPDELKKLRRLIKTTYAKADAKTVWVSGNVAIDPVPYLTDDVIVTAIRALTALDSDHAALSNSEGWSKKTSSPGHWCAAMLRTDRALAIKEGRRLVASHLPQLAKLGVIDWSVVPANRRAA